MLPVDALESAIKASEECDVFFSIGTSGVVYPAADLWRRAKNNGAIVVEINKDSTTLTALADYSFLGKAGDVLPELVRQVWIPESAGGL